MVHLDPGLGKQALLSGQLYALVPEAAVHSLPRPGCVLVIEYPLGAKTLMARLLRVHALYQVVIELVELKEAKHNHQEQVEAFIEPTNITDPVQQTIDISVDSVEIQIKLKRDLQMDPIRELVWSHRLENV